MSKALAEEGHGHQEDAEKVLARYHKAALEKEAYLLRRQRKEILATCARVAVAGASADKDSRSYVSAEKLLGLGLEIVPILPGIEVYLGMRTFRSLDSIPGQVDVLLVFAGEGLDLMRLAREAVAKKVKTFWIEDGYAPAEVKEALADGKVQVVEHESFDREYVKNFPFPPREVRRFPAGRKSVTVKDRMTANPVTARPKESIHDAIEKMRNGHFRHLPVVDEQGQLIGMLSDRDIRLIRPSRAFVSGEDEAIQLWSTSVRQAAVFNPVTIPPNASVESAAELMLRWEIGGLPVVDEGGRPIGMITYTDLLREFLARGK